MFSHIWYYGILPSTEQSRQTYDPVTHASGRRAPLVRTSVRADGEAAGWWILDIAAPLAGLAELAVESGAGE